MDSFPHFGLAVYGGRLRFVMRLLSTVWNSVYNGLVVGTEDTCPQESLSLLEREVEVAVRLARHLPNYRL